MRTKLYICGPMRGYPMLNFPGFFAAQDDLEAEGYATSNPAEMDIRHGITAETDPDSITHEQWLDTVRRDVNAIIDSNGIALLEGWGASDGVMGLELPLARFLKLPIKEVPTWILDARQKAALASPSTSSTPATDE